MFESIIYIISVIILLITFLLIKKSDKKQNLLLWIFISIMFMFCYNAIIVYILSALYIRSTLITLSIVNIFISILLYLFLLKNKNIQKYYIQKVDILAIFALVIVTIIIGYIRFGFPFKIVYETCDPGTHFWTSMDFFRESILLNKADSTIDFSARVFGSYVNMGIALKIFYPIVGYINLYAIYIAFDIFMLFMSGISFYFLMRYLCKENKFWIILIGSIIYLAGYPLNSMIFGFFYSGHVVILFTTLILLFKFFDNKEIDNKYILFLIMLLNIGICFTYYLYTPIVVISGIIYFIYKFKYELNLNIKKYYKQILLVVGIPLILTCLYFIFPYIGNNQHNIFYQLTLDGYFYNSYLSNFILFIPLIVYYIINMLKNKKINFEILLFFLIISFILGIILLSIFDLAVQYYASKFFYMLWLLCFVLTFNLLIQPETNRTFSSIYICTFLLAMFFSIFSIEDKLYDKNTAFGNKIESFNILNVYSWNIDKIKYSNITFTLNEIDILRKLYDIKAENVVNNFIHTFNSQRLWLNAFFWSEKLDYPENEIYDYMVNNGIFFDPLEHECYWDMDQKYKYFVIFYREFDDMKWMNYNDIFPFEVLRRWDLNFRKDYTINRKDIYDSIDRSTCINCQFIDFDDGVIIIK